MRPGKYVLQEAPTLTKTVGRKILNLAKLGLAATAGYGLGRKDGVDSSIKPLNKDLNRGRGGF